MEEIGCAVGGDGYIVKLTRFEMDVLSEAIESRRPSDEELELMQWFDRFFSSLSELSLPRGVETMLVRSLLEQPELYRSSGKLMEFAEWAELVRMQPYEKSPLFGIRNFGAQGHKLSVEALSSKWRKESSMTDQTIDTGDHVRHALAQFDIPPDARWIAVDYDGATYAFTGKPICFDGKHWMSDGEYSWHLGTIDMAGVDHQKTLVPVNQP